MKEKCKVKVLVLTAFLFLSNLMFAQQKNISGTVTDSKGEPIIGASILAKGSTSGTITDLDGKFTLSVPTSTRVLVVSYVGMKTQEVSASGSTVKVVLEDDAKSLDDVVVIGYGSKVRANLTGSVGSVSGAALSRVPVSSAAEALQGKVAGVQVTSVDGAPGSEINIRVRGGTSVTQSNAPLFIVDGFPVSSISDIPVTDIQSVDVLKDASLTAIYGAKGGNGVVIVTTKSAKAGKVQLTFNHTTQFRTLARKLDLMDPYEYVRVQYDGVVSSSSSLYKFRGNFGNPADFELYKRFKGGNDWQDEIMGGTPISQMYNLTVNGGNDNLKFNTSVTHNDERGVLSGTGVIRTSVNTKVSANLSKKVKLLINPRFGYRQTNGTGADAVGTGGIIDVLRYRPTNGLRDFGHVSSDLLDPEEEKYFQYTNPKNYLSQNYLKANNYEFTNQATLEWNILKGLTFRSDGMQYMSFYDQSRVWGYMTSTAKNNNSLPVADITSKKGLKFQLTNVLSYGFNVGESNFSALIGQEVQHSQSKQNYIKNRYFPQDIDPEIALVNMNLGTPWITTTSISCPDRTASFFGQFSYDYAHKYLASATMRADASTKFAPGKQWGYFPAVSAAWVMSKEGFMQDQSTVSQLKLRLAVGKAGNNRIDDDMWRYLYAIYATGGPGWGETSDAGYEYYASADGSRFTNSNIKWETTLTRNFAIDFGLFNDRITITPEVYWNTTSDLLYLADIPVTTGYSKQMQNIGQVTNRGFELTINGTIINKKNFQLNGNFTFGSNKTRVDKLTGNETEVWSTSSRWSSSDYDYCLKVGDEIGLIYGYKYDGIYGFDEFDLNNSYGYTAKSGTVNSDALYGTAPGKPKFVNVVDGVDGANDVNVVNANDRVVIGNTNPDFTGGFGFNGTYKAFDFSCNFNFMYGFDVNNATAYTLSSFENNSNNYYNVLSKYNLKNRWRYANDIGDRMLNDSRFVQEYVDVNSKATIFNPIDITKKVTMSYFIEDGSFLRLQDVTLGYTLPKALVKKVGIDNLRIYFSGYNLFLLTKYSGYDPEVDVQSGLTPGVDYNRYPRSRNFVLGLNLTL